MLIDTSKLRDDQLIRMARAKLGMKQKDFATFVGFSQPYITGCECGKSKIKLLLGKEILRILEDSTQVGGIGISKISSILDIEPKYEKDIGYRQKREKFNDTWYLVRKISGRGMDKRYWYGYKYEKGKIIWKYVGKDKSKSKEILK